MKKIIRLLLTAVLCINMFAFAACGDEEQDLSGTMTVVVAADVPIAYTVELENIAITEGVLSILKYLAETEGLDFAAESSGFGAFLTKVGEIEADSSKSTFICIYTSVDRDFDVTVYATTVSYEGQTLTSSGLGVAEMTITKDCTIYFGLSSY